MALNDIPDEQFRQNVRTLQIINGALAAGVVSFLMVVLVIRGTPVPTAVPDFLTYVSSGFFCMALVASWIVPIAMTRGQLGHIARGSWKPPAQPSADVDLSADSMKVLMAYHIQAIVRWAILEGAAFFNLMVYQLEGHWLSLGVSLLALALLLFLFPTRGRVENWIERQEQQIGALRQWPQAR